MKKELILLGTSVLVSFMASGQSAIDAFRFSQPDLKGTARFMSMAGAFGALGGDLSTLSQNPAGIGVYRSNEIGFTLDLDLQRATSSAQGYSNSVNQTKFLLNNIGGIATLRLKSDVMPNFNFGFTYNRASSFNRKYSGHINKLSNSLSNYFAGISNYNGLTVGDVSSTPSFDPYNPNDGLPGAPWSSILAYNSYLISPVGDPDNPVWEGQWGEGTSGSGLFSGIESGSFDEFNIALGGNIKNKVYWGMDFCITNLTYNLDGLWGERLDNAYVGNKSGTIDRTEADWSLFNHYRTTGTGFNYKIGVIVKPIQELRIGVSFHTPTWMALNETFYSTVDYKYGTGVNGFATTNGGYDGYNSMNFRTPLKLIGSIAGVLFNRLIVSADYEWSPYQRMKFSEADTYGGYYDDWYPGWGYWDNAAGLVRSGYITSDPFKETNDDIKTYYQGSSTVRIGAEYRVTQRFSVRAGYCYTSSPVKQAARDNTMSIYTSRTSMDYMFNNSTQYITCGLGYRWNNFYTDLAYMHKRLDTTYHAYTPDPASPQYPSPQSDVVFSNNQLVLSCGVRF